MYISRAPPLAPLCPLCPCGNPSLNLIMECMVLSMVGQTRLLPRSHSQTIVEVGIQSTQHYYFNQTQRDGGG